MEKLKTIKMEEEAKEYQKKLKEERDKAQELKLKNRQDIEMKIKERREKQKEFFDLQHNEFSKVIKQKPKYLELEKNFNELNKNITLEERKQRLQELRSLKKPLDRNEFIEHENFYKQRQRETEIAIKSNRDATIKM